MISLYLDPGSGSFLLQLLIAGLAGIGIAVASQWAKLKRFINNRKKKTQDDDENEDENEDE
jgi:mannose/fructose/N-acetylgalactosamine-specific phosphotransferase system component IIC